MKILFNKIIVIALVVLIGLSFSACANGKKYKNNGHNGFFLDQKKLCFVREGELHELNLENGDNYTSKSTDIDVNKIIGIQRGCIYYVNENHICWSLHNIEESIERVELPKNNYESILITNDTVFYFLYTNKKIELYTGVQTPQYVGEVPLEKNYDTIVLLKSKYSKFYKNNNNVYTIGLIKGEKIELLDIEVILVDSNAEQKVYNISSQKKGEIVLDKQYDGYVYGTISYDGGEFIGLEPAEYLVCIEDSKEHKIKFYDIKRGQFATVPIKGGEWSWTF